MVPPGQGYKQCLCEGWLGITRQEMSSSKGREAKSWSRQVLAVGLCSSM